MQDRDAQLMQEVFQGFSFWCACGRSLAENTEQLDSQEFTENTGSELAYHKRQSHGPMLNGSGNKLALNEVDEPSTLSVHTLLDLQTALWPGDE